jgi:hypothetical protein
MRIISCLAIDKSHQVNTTRVFFIQSPLLVILDNLLDCCVYRTASESVRLCHDML